MQVGQGLFPSFWAWGSLVLILGCISLRLLGACIAFRLLRLSPSLPGRALVILIITGRGLALLAFI